MKLHQETLAFLSLLLGAATTLSGIIFWYRNAVRKTYAAERDFNHLKRNQEQILNNLEYLLKEQDRRFDTIDKEIIEIKAKYPPRKQRDEYWQEPS